MYVRILYDIKYIIQHDKYATQKNINTTLSNSMFAYSLVNVQRMYR